MLKSNQLSLLVLCTSALLFQNLLFPVLSSTSFADQKTYYSPDPHSGTPSSGSSHHSPSHGSHHHSPSHGSPAANCGNPPSGGGGHHHSPTPSTPSGGGGHSYSPPSVDPTPSSPSGGGGYSYSPPSVDPTPVSPPSGGGGGGYSYSPPLVDLTPPSVDPTPISPPSGGGGGYSYAPPSVDPTPSSPSGGGGGYTYSPPTSDTVPTPIDPGTGSGSPIIPGISSPSPPFGFDPNSPPFTCNIWGSHPTLIWGVLGYFGTVGSLFGATSYPGFGGSTMSLQEALLNTRSDPIGALYREGTASLLNSMATEKFPYTTNQVRDRFVSALSSNKAAASQARLFKLANEGHIVPRA